MSLYSIWGALVGTTAAANLSGNHALGIIGGAALGYISGDFVEYLLNHKTDPEVQHFVGKWGIASTLGCLIYYGTGQITVAGCATMMAVNLINNTTAPTARRQPTP